VIEQGATEPLAPARRAGKEGHRRPEKGKRNLDVGEEKGKFTAVAAWITKSRDEEIGISRVWD